MFTMSEECVKFFVEASIENVRIDLFTLISVICIEYAVAVVLFI